MQTRQGFVYVLMNQSLPGCVKIGRTTRDSTVRAAELSSATGVPTPFLVAFEAYFENCEDAETYIHAVLESEGVRLASNREFFSVTASQAINAVIKAKSKFEAASLNILESNYNKTITSGLILPEQETWVQVFEEAEDYLYGMGEKLEDKEKALALFKTAAKLGSGKAYVHLGEHYQGAAGFDWIKRGADAGHSECWLMLATIFNGENYYFNEIYVNLENCKKSYRKFFEVIDIEQLEDRLLFFSLKEYLKIIDHKPSEFDSNVLKKFLPNFLSHLQKSSSDEDQVAKINQLTILCGEYFH